MVKECEGARDTAFTLSPSHSLTHGSAGSFLPSQSLFGISVIWPGIPLTMSLRIATLLLLLSWAPLALAQFVFTRTVGTATGQAGVGVAAVSNGYWIGSRSFDQATNAHRAMLIQCEMDGTPVSETHLPIDGRVFVRSMVAAANGKHFLCGSGFAPGAKDHDGLVALLAADGSATWVARPQVPGDQLYHGAAPLPDGGVVVCGMAPVNGLARPLIGRFDADGSQLWHRIVEDEPGGIARAVAVDATGMVISGRRVNPSGFADTWLTRLDLEGNTVWTSAVGGVKDDESHALVRSPDGHFISAGYTDSYGPVHNDSLRRRCVHLVKVDGSTGDTLWTRTAGDILRDRMALAIDVAPNGDAIVAGTRAHAPGRSNALVQRFDPQGNILWEHNYEAGKEDRLVHVRALPDGFVATGASFGVEGHKVLLIRRGALGE